MSRSAANHNTKSGAVHWCWFCEERTASGRCACRRRQIEKVGDLKQREGESESDD